VDDDVDDVVHDSGDEKLVNLGSMGNESRDRLWRFSRLDNFRRILFVDDDIVEATEELSSLLVLSSCFVSGNQCLKIRDTPFPTCLPLRSSNKGLKSSRFRDSIAFLRALARPVKPSSADFEASSVCIVFDGDSVDC
jgi:hypothetical protein